MGHGPQAVNGPQLTLLNLKPFFLWLVVKKRIIYCLNVQRSVVRSCQTGFFEDFGVGRVRMGHSRDVLR